MGRWRNTKKYKNWVKACKERDGHKCVVTGAYTNLHVHHINHASYFKNQRYDVSNGVTVHRVVHLIFHILIMRGYRKKCTEKDWKRFLRLFRYIKRISKLINSV